MPDIDRRRFLSGLAASSLPPAFVGALDRVAEAMQGRSLPSAWRLSLEPATGPFTLCSIALHATSPPGYGPAVYRAANGWQTDLTTFTHAVSQTTARASGSSGSPLQCCRRQVSLVPCAYPLRRSCARADA